MKEGQAQWKNGILDKAVSTLQKAAKIDPSNKKIAKALKGMQGQKKTMDDALIQVGKFIEHKKFKQAENVLKKVEHISSKYPPYMEMVKKLKHATVELPQPPKPGDLAYAKSFAGKWNSTYGVMTLTVQGLRVSGNYTHDKGRIEAVLSEDGKTMKGTWAESPSYKGSRDAGKMYFKLSSDAKKIDGLWSYGDAVPTGNWTATRIVDTQPQPPGIAQPEQKPPKEIKPTRENPGDKISSLVGSWNFGRSKHYGKPVQEHLCTLTLTDEPVEGIGYKVKSCHANESYWILEGKVLLFVHLDGTITTKFTEVRPNYWEGTYVGNSHSGEGVVFYLKKSDGEIDVTKPNVTNDIIGNTKTSTTYTPNTKGDVFKGGHWAGASGGSDWLQKDFFSPQLVTGVYIGRASTDIRTKGFRLILKLKKSTGEWITIDKLHDTNINRTALSGGAIGKSIPSYTKKLSPAIKATAFRLEFYGHGWFDATDIRIYTSKISEKNKEQIAKRAREIMKKAEIREQERKIAKEKALQEEAEKFKEDLEQLEQAKKELLEIEEAIKLIEEEEKRAAEEAPASVEPPQKLKTEKADNTGGVVNGPKKPTTFKFDTRVKLLFLQTYHWNNSIGMTSPGQIGLRHNDGTMYGPWQTRGRAGQGGVPNAYWEVNPNVLLKPGVYTVVDSNPKTWSTNAQEDWKGFAIIRTAPLNYPDENPEAEKGQRINDQRAGGAHVATNGVYGTIQGSWRGKGVEGDFFYGGITFNGSFEIMISENGRVTGSYSGSDSGKLKGKLSSSGEISLQCGRACVWTGHVKADDQGNLQCSGDFNYRDSIKGTWSGNRIKYGK